MVRTKKTFRFSLMVLAGLVVLIGPLLSGLTDLQPTVLASGCWKAEITEQWINLELVGSVLRVAVQGKAGLPVWVRSLGGFETYNYTGTKPEYGPFVAEFAPMSRGIYFIEPQGLGVVFEVWLDGKNYTRVDFVPVPCETTSTPVPQAAPATPRPQPTATRQPAVAPTSLPPATTQPPQPAVGWHGRVVEHLKGLAGRYFATIAVRVIGRPAGQEVEIRSDPWSATCKTGTKPEHGPDACEFGSLNAGTYRLIPRDLGTHLDVTVGLQDFVLVEFTYSGPTPQTYWVGSVVQNTSGEPTEHANSAVAVVVAGKPWHEVEIRSNNWSTTAETGYKPEHGPDACEFGGLRAGTYTITPKDLGASVQVTMDGWGWAMVRFDEVAAPAPQPAVPATQPTAVPVQPTTSAHGPTATPEPSPTSTLPRWQGRVVSNTSGQQQGSGVWSVVVVRVLNRAGVPVTISGGGGWSATCISGTKPEYGPDACEFGGLWPGTYYLQPEGADIQVEVEMDGIGVAFVEFAAP